MRSKIKKFFKETNRKSLTIYLILRAFVIITLIRHLLLKDYTSAALCLLSLILFTIPGILKNKVKINIPSTLEGIIYIFIFSAEILGEINNFYVRIPHWDTLLHTLNGFLCAGIGFSLVNLLNENSNKIKLSPIYLSIVAFCFSMTIGVFWEFFEYTMDNIFKMDMQKDTIITDINSTYLDETLENKVIKIKNIKETNLTTNNEEKTIKGYLDIGLIDTMEDLIVNFIGAFIFSIFGFLYIKNKNKYKLAKKFIISRNNN